MTDRCIHGFDPQHCASCRRCAHGLSGGRCAVCNPKTAREASAMLANDAPLPSEEHRGYALEYAAGERSWYIRADDGGSRSTMSYRSAFSARRAIDAMLDAPPAAVAAEGKKGKKKRG
jgi:hypothetical protein